MKHLAGGVTQFPRQARLMVWRTFLTISNISTMTMGIFTWDVRITEKDDNNYYTCQFETDFDQTQLAVIAMIDILACGVNLALFIIPFSQIHKRMNSLKDYSSTTGTASGSGSLGYE